MVNINYIEEYLKSKKKQKVNVKCVGMIEFELDILNFNFCFENNLLKLMNNDNIVFKIKFDEVRSVENRKDNICILFNISQKIIIQ